MRARIEGVFRTPAKGLAPVRAEGPCEVRPWGLEGDHRTEEGGPRTRAGRVLLLVGADNSADLGLGPGEMREQVSIAGFDPDRAPLGTELSIGGLHLRLTKRCDPCSTLARYLGEEADALIARTDGRRGTFAEVLSPGTIEEGAEVVVKG